MKSVRHRVRTLLKAILALAFIVMFFRWFEHSQVFHPSRTLDASAADLGRPFEDVFFKTSDNVELNGWFFPAGTNSPRKEWVLLFCHGNGGNISHRLDVYQTFLEAGVNVFALDYRGYGRSQGRPSEVGTYLDAQAAHAWLRKKGFAAKKIVAYGESLGGGIASELCLREETGGLILQSTFTSIPDLGAEIYPWLPVKLIGGIKYDIRKKLPRLKIPVLVMHSRNDSLVGYRHCETNFAAANEPKLFCELRGGHNDPLEDGKAFVGGLEKFLELAERYRASTSTASPR
jgi:uncharacterized protein